MQSDPKIRAVIFDRDGVLTHFDTKALSDRLRPILSISLGELIVLWNEWGAEVGMPRSLEEEERFLSGFWDHVGVLQELTPSQIAELHEIDYTDFVCAFPDAVPAMQYVRGCGLKIGVLSNFGLASLDASLDAAGFGNMFDVACAATVIGASKPSIEAYLVTAKRLDVAPEECLFFDDELECVDGALRAGMKAYCVQRYFDRESIGIEEVNIVADLTVLPDLVQP